MQDNPDLKDLINMFNGSDLSHTVNRLKKMLDASQPQRDANLVQTINRPDGKTAHVDPNINLLLAIIPLLPGEKQRQAEYLLKPLNLLFFARKYLYILNESDISLT